MKRKYLLTVLVIFLILALTGCNPKTKLYAEVILETDKETLIILGEPGGLISIFNYNDFDWNNIEACINESWYRKIPKLKSGAKILFGIDSFLTKDGKPFNVFERQVLEIKIKADEGECLIKFEPESKEMFY